MQTDEGLDFALFRKTGRIVDITMVERGLRCDCVCAHCGAALLARKGRKNRHHFAHFVDGQVRGTCGHGRESALHKAAKQIIADWQHIELPGYRICEGGFEESLPGRAFQITRSAMPDEGESRRFRTQGSVRPDVILHSHEKEIWCEVKVTHAVDEAKQSRLRDYGVSTLEFDLSRMYRLGGWTLATLELALRTDDSIRTWAFHAEGEKVRQRLRKRREQLDAERLAKRAQTSGLGADPTPLTERSRVLKLGPDPLAGLNLQDGGELVFHLAMGLIPKDPQKRLEFIARSYAPPKSYKLKRAIAYLRVHPHWDSTCLVTFACAGEHGRTGEYDAALSEFASSAKLTCQYFAIPESRQVRGKSCHRLLDGFLTRLQAAGD